MNEAPRYCNVVGLLVNRWNLWYPVIAVPLPLHWEGGELDECDNFFRTVRRSRYRIVLYLQVA